MNLDEFAFVNQQLAGMLRTGIPLEGALRQLAGGLKAGALKNELTTLEADLATGTPLPEALHRRQLPPVYRAMLQAGSRANDLPGVLTLLADHYQRNAITGARVRTLMVYPLMVLGTALLLSVAMAWLMNSLEGSVRIEILSGLTPNSTVPFGNPFLWASTLAPPLFLIAILGALGGIALRPAWRQRLRWRLPGFREAALAQLASSLELMVGRGVPLPEAIDLLQAAEGDSPMGRELTRWRSNLREGRPPLADPHEKCPTPPLFQWLVASAGEDLVGGFRKAAAIFEARARHRIDMMVFGLLPVSVLLLGAMVVTQALPLFHLLRQMGYLGGLVE